MPLSRSRRIPLLTFIILLLVRLGILIKGNVDKR
jgi:hypothetical protein